MTTSLDFSRYEDILRSYLPYADGAPLTGTTVLSDLGLDSLGTVQLLAELEAEFDIELPDEALTERTFDTVESLWNAFAFAFASSTP